MKNKKQKKRKEKYLYPTRSICSSSDFAMLINIELIIMLTPH